MIALAEPWIRQNADAPDARLRRTQLHAEAFRVVSNRGPIRYPVPWDKLPGFVRSTDALACLNHRVRYQWVHPLRFRRDPLRGIRPDGLCSTYHSWCGCTFSDDRSAKGRPMVIVFDDTPTFVCLRCEEAATRAGMDPTKALHDNGCTMSGGARFRGGPRTAEEKA